MVFMLFMVGMCACGTAGTHEATAPPFQNVVEDVAYVGDAQCATCHEAEFNGFREHGMARGFYRLTSTTAVEDFSGTVVRHQETGFYYVARKAGDQYVQEEYRLDAGGAKTHQLVRTMDYVIGSGSAARTYLTEVDGRLYELPLTWYTQANGGQGRWDFSPGYAEVNGRFERAIPPGCMSCHNGTSEPVAHVQGKYISLAQGIGCEQCHGPGQLHVEARLADPEPADSIDLTIVNPAHLPVGLRLDVCQQCHTNGAVSILREGETAYSFRPSQPLDEHVAIFGIASDESNSISVISHADRMKRSRCFTVSQTMDCVTCHNPHEGFREAGPSYFNDTCISCHAPVGLQAALASSESRSDHAAQSNCFSCHMPKVAADDAPHASFTDHFIRVVGDDAVPEGIEAHGELELQPYFERDRAGAEAEAYTGMAYVVYGRQNTNRTVMQRGISMLAGALEEKPEIGEAQYLLGFARLQLGQAAAAIPALEEAIRLNPEVPERLNTLAQAYEAVGRDPSSIEQLYHRALAVQPSEASIRVNLGRFLEAQSRVDEALTEYQRASRDEPWLASAHYNLGTAFLRSGRTAEGERSLREAVHLEPDYSDALTNLGVVVAGRGDANRARALFLRAVDTDPLNANALANLGTFYLQTRQTNEAVHILQRAVEANPRHIDALANLALAFAEAGNATQARHYARQALSINPNHLTAQQVLASL